MRWKVLLTFWSQIFFESIHIPCTTSFVIIVNHQSAIENYILFDSKISGDDEVIASNYTYRISHHKTQSWVHRLVQFDIDGHLRLRRALDTCSSVSLVPGNSFLVYIDIVASHYHPQHLGQSLSKSKSLTKDTYPIDYISYPLLIIISNNPDCEDHEKGPFTQIRTQETQNHHWIRSIDDIYISLPVQGDFCHHASEKITNLFQLMPQTVKSYCKIIAKGDHFLGIEPITNDIALKSDFCLFESFHTTEIYIKMECQFLEEEKSLISSWDQLIHFIIHRLGPSSIGKGGSLDPTHFERHPIHRIRREMRNQAPYFEQTLYKVGVPEEQPPGITITTLGAIDPENTPLTYTMTSLLDSRSQQFFIVDPKSGIVTSNEKLDREKMDVHYFRIVATDSGIPPRTGTATLEISVQDVNDHSPAFEQSSYSISIREGISVGSTVISVRARDEDSGKNGEISYSILNSHDIDDAFRIDPTTGVITTKLPLDRESREDYSILVQATDMSQSQLDRKTVTTTVRIEVKDENDNYPHFSSKAYTVTVPENFDVSNYPVIARVSATDADEGVNSALRYSIIGGNSQNHFSIDSLTGEVSLLKSIDYENTRSFRLNIRAIDSGNPSRSNSTQLLVSVEDKNDNPPKFFQTIFQETVLENLPIGSSALKIQAFDADDELNSKLQYRISFRENPEKFPFRIDSDSGWIITTLGLDREIQNRYDFNVIAADSGDTPLSSTASVVIIVQDVNDNDPAFSPKLYETTISEQEPPGTPVETVKATDPDENSRLFYEITEGNTRNRFSISTQNGEGRIAIAQPLDFKSERKFVLSVKAIDSGGRFDIATVYVEVLDSNSNAPVFQGTPYSVKIFEDVPIGSTVLTVMATDQDSGSNAQIVYTFVEDRENEGYEDFMIDSLTGAITTSKLLDREKISGYILTVIAKDKGIPPLSDTTDVEIVLNDVNDLSPQFEKDFYQAKVSEDVPIGTSILQVQASDGDQGKNSIIRYSFSTFSDGDGTFSVDSASGIIRTIKLLDRETVSRYDLMVLATDSGSPELTGKTKIKIEIQDVNDNPPMYESDRIRFFIQENSPLGSTVGRLQAYDPDEGPNAIITYSVVGGVDANSFTLVTHQQPNGVDTGTADILTKIENLDFESKRKKFDIIVRASSPPLRNDVHVEIHVQDVNDNAPVLKPFEIILNNYKDHFPVGPIGQVPAVDADLTDTLQYSILSGNKANLVYLNESTGLITLSPYLDTNVPLSAKMEILVTDGLNEARAEMTLHTRMITDDLLFNAVTVQLGDMTTEAFLSPLYTQFLQALAVALNSPRDNILIFSVQEEIADSHSVLNVSFSARKPNSIGEDYFSPDYIRERVYLNRVLLSKLSTVEVLPFADDLCLLEPCPNFEDCLSVLRFRNATGFFGTESMLFRSVLPWPTFACRCPLGFTGLREHYLCDAEINLCFSTPCANGGTCHRREHGFTCTCPPEWTGKQCQVSLSSDQCPVSNICSRGSNCHPRLRGGFICQNCSSRGEHVNSLCELSARSFYRGAYLTFPGLKNRYRLHLDLQFATQQRNGLLLYNGRYNEKFDFIALEIVNSTVRFSFSLGSLNVTRVQTGKIVSDGSWHRIQLHYFNKTAILTVDDCDVTLSLAHPDEFPPSKSCAGRSSQVLERRCDLLIESCQRFLDLTGPLYIGGLPTPLGSFQIESHNFLGCIKHVHIDYKFLDLNNYVKEHGTVAGCPEKKNFCVSQPCKNGGKCVEVWGTFRCNCADGFGQKDCSEDAKPTWTLREETSHLTFTPQLRPVQFPWFNSISIRTLRPVGIIFSIKLSNNDTISLSLDSNGLLHYTLDGVKIPLSLPRINDGRWHNVEVKWMTAEIWFSLDFGQYEITIQYEAKLHNLYVSQVLIGSVMGAFIGCVQDVRIGGPKSYLRKAATESGVSEGCSFATACIGATCPPRSTCIEESGRHKCQCDPGFVGINCLPICDLQPCQHNGTCSLDLTKSRGYRCQCNDRFYRGANCQELLDLSCPSTWWNWPDCAPCACPAEKNFSPECHKRTGECKCKEYHYERNGNCMDCMCYTLGSVSKNCDLTSGKCQCREGVSGNRCDSCSNPLGEVTLDGCEIVEDGCPRSFSNDIWWPRSKFGMSPIHDCPSGSIGLAIRDCTDRRGWESPDVFNCTSTSFISILNVIAQLDSKNLLLSPLLSTKLAADLHRALNSSAHLYGNDIWISLRLIRHLIRCELEQKGLYLSHRQDKNFIKNMALSTSKITGKDHASNWARIGNTYGFDSDTLLKIMDDYLAQLTLNQEDTYTRPFEIITPNLVMGLDTIELTWDNKNRKNFEDFEIKSTYDLYEVSTIRKRAVQFPKYDNIIKDPRRYLSVAKIILPLDVLGLNEDKDMAGNAVVGYIEYYTLWDILPKRFLPDVDRRFNSELIAYPPLITLSVLASQIGLRQGKLGSPIRITYELFGRYLDSSNPQCVIWEEPKINESSSGGWTTRHCSSEVEEAYSSSQLTNVMTVNCTCWHLSTFALLIENNETQDIPRPSLVEDIISYIAFITALVLIFGALIALGLLKGPVPSTITNTIHKHLLFSIFIVILLFGIGLKLRLILVQADIPCRILAIGLHFGWLATFAWLFGSALHLRRMFHEIRDVNHGSPICYYALGYAFPLLCVALSLGVRAHHYGNKFFCWLSLYEGIVWGMVGPILLCIVGSLLTFLVAVQAAFTLKDSVVDSGSMRTLLWMDLTLLPLTGSVWALCLLGANERSPTWQYAISVSVIMLSLYIALGYCVFNQRVKDSLYIRAGSLFKPRDDATINPSTTSRSALAYRSEAATLRADDLRRDLFQGMRSMGISTASTTSRSTIKTSSSPYRSEVFHTFGKKSAKFRHHHKRESEGDIIESPRKAHSRRKRRSSEEEGSSEGERTLELASSHSSDEDEAIPCADINPNTATIDLRSNQQTGGISSGNSGSDNENPGSGAGSIVGHDYPKVLNSVESLQGRDYMETYLGESKYGEKLPFLLQDQYVNDLNLSRQSPSFGHGHITGNPLMPYHLSVVSRPIDSPISPVQEIIDETLSSEHDTKHETGHGGEIGKNSNVPGMLIDSQFEEHENEGHQRHDNDDEDDIYGGSITSGVLV